MWLANGSAVFGVAVLAAAALGAGFWMEGRLPPSFGPLERLAFSWIGGLGTLSLFLFVIGQVVFTRTSILGTVVVSLLLAIRPIRRRLRTEPSSWKIKIDVIPATVIILVLLVTAVGGLAEIVGDWENDAIAYHLLGPKVWLRNGIIRPLPDNCHTAFPAVAEVFYGALMSIGGSRAPGFFAVATLAVFFLIAYSVAIRAGLEQQKAWWVVALVAAMPAVYAGGHSTFVDALYAGFLLVAACVGLQRSFAGQAILFGLFCGFAMATKYTGLMAVPALIVLAGIFRPRFNESGWREAIAYSKASVLVGILVALPFYLRNWLMLGFPIYPPPPIASKLFPVKYLSMGAIASFHSYIHNRGAGLGRGLGALILLPFNLTYHAANFHGAGGIGLTALALGPFGLIAAWRDDLGRSLALLGMALTTFWFFTQQESRFLIPVYVIGSVFGVLGWQYIRAIAQGRSRVLCGAVIGCSLIYGLFMIGSARLIDLKAAISSRFAEQHRQGSIPFLQSFEYLNAEPSVNRVLVLDRSVPVYYLNKSYLKSFGQWGEQVLPEARNSAEVLAELPPLHVTHILDVRSPVGDFQVPVNSPDVELVFEAENQRVYRLP